MRVIFDTNVLISAFTTRGLCAEIVEDVIARHHLLVGELVLHEFEYVLTDKFAFDQELLQVTIEYLRTFTIVPVPKDYSAIDELDENDTLILQSAISASADLFVTGDSDFLRLQKETHGIKILSPRDHWKILQVI